MNVLDLFSGIGGFSLGLERAGMRTVAFCEIEPYCRAVLRKHWPDVPIFEDVRKLTAADVPGVDVICGGFPCQDISVAGHQKGIEGERSGLWSEYSRLICEIRPRYIIVENVANLLGRGLSRVIGDLAASGYDTEWHCIQAAAVGLPHFRDRVWILAYPVASRQDAVLAEIRQSCEASARENRQRFQLCGTRSGGTRWIPDDVVCSVVDGISEHLDGLAAAGNAVVPQIPEIIGRAIMQAEGLI